MPNKLTQTPEWNPPRDRETITLELRTITPMFGGGHKTGEIDVVWPIRPAAIRGALRFWWRATAGAQYATAQELYKAEAKLWGTEAGEGKPGSSRISIEVTNPVASRIQRADWFTQGMSDPRRYALFPFIQNEQSGTERGTTAIVIVGVHRYEKHDIEHLLTAISYWTYFGGLGARTRRGCGAIEIVNTTHSLPTVAPINNEKLIRRLTTSPYKIFRGEATSNSEEAWANALQLYRNFRQAPDDSARKRSYQRTNIYGNHHVNDRGKAILMPGRSLWPEPDTIRRITGQAADYTDKDQIQKDHQTPIVATEGFPRADLGLPIIFHFKDNNREGTDTRSNRDPRNTTLEPPDGYSRFASPVIVKAVAIGGGKYLPMIAILNSPHVWEMGALKLVNTNKAIPQSDVTLDQTRRDKVKQLKGHLGVREALCAYVKNQPGWTEVTI